jgi:prevent-host-death family protein
MTMVAKRMREIPAGEFKAKCLQLLDNVSKTGPFVVTKRGRPVAKVVPLEDTLDVPLKGLIVKQGDLISPLDEPWDAEQ